MRRIMLRSLFIVLMLISASCRETGNPASESPVAPSPQEPFRIGVLLPSPHNDMAFSQSMFDSLTKLQQEMGADNLEFAVTENVLSYDEAWMALTQYASSGYNLVIAHGSHLVDPLRKVAPQFPETSFAWGADSRPLGLGNVFNYDAAAEQGGYVNGVLAASLSKRGVIGVVGPVEVGDAKLGAYFS